ncbi:hypothetical protein NXS19_003179 [Fusarium pseudograminearum]|nr:hypothetical protein NXS19_003179 [Fusarium pseudograminearum]
MQIRQTEVPGMPWCVISICSTLYLLSCTNTRTVFSLVATPSALEPTSSGSATCKGGEKPGIGHFVPLLLQLYLVSSVWLSSTLFKRSAFHL